MILKSIKYLFILITLFGAGIGIWLAFHYHQKIYAPTVLLNSEQEVYYVKIPTGTDFEKLVTLLLKQEVVSDSAGFVWTAELMGFNQRVLAGKYRIKQGMNNRELVSLLRSGVQEPVQVRLPEVNRIPEIAGIFGSYLEADSSALLQLMQDEDFLAGVDLTPLTIKTIFLPDTYEFYWNTGPEDIIQRMIREYNRFWNNERLMRAETIGMRPAEVITLASIVQKETYQTEEMPVIAGVYINRLNRGMKLQADPTVLYAINDPTIRRLRHRHLQTVSPYNTYMYAGLPPGPISLPGKMAIDAVLYAEEHDYLYFCAKADFSGYHEFNRSYREHLRCARRYQQELSQMGIHN